MSIQPKMMAALLAVVLGSTVHANDHEEKKEESHQAEGHSSEGNKEGGGHGEAAPSTLAPWIAVEAKIQELHSKVKSKEASILKLIEEKNHLPSQSPHVKGIVKELVKEHQDLQKLAEQYQQQVSILKYRFPERNAKMKRTYERVDVKSVEEMESAAGVDGKLTRNLKKMRSQFHVEGVNREPASSHQKSEIQPHKKPNTEKSIEEAPSVILQK